MLYVGLCCSPFSVFPSTDTPSRARVSGFGCLAGEPGVVDRAPLPARPLPAVPRARPRLAIVRVDQTKKGVYCLLPMDIQ